MFTKTSGSKGPAMKQGKGLFGAGTPTSAYYILAVVGLSVAMTFVEQVMQDSYVVFGIGAIVAYGVVECLLRRKPAKKAAAKRFDKLGDIQHAAADDEAGSVPGLRVEDALPKASRSQNVDQIWKLLGRREKTGEEVSADKLAFAIQACAKADDKGEGLAVRGAEACLAAMRAQHYLVDLPFFTALLKTCGNAGEADKAEEYLLQISKAGLVANLDCYNAQLMACARQKDLARAESWLARMQAAGVPGGPDAASYQLVLEACSTLNQAEDWVDKQQTTEAAQQLTLRSCLVRRCLKAGEMARASVNMGTMLNLAAKKKEGHSTEAAVGPVCDAFAALIMTAAKTGDRQGAERWLKQLQEFDGATVDVVSCCMMLLDAANNPVAERNGEAASTATKPEDWLEKAGRCARGQADVQTYNSLIIGCCLRAPGSGDVKRAEELMAEMKNKGKEPNIVTFGVVIGTCAKSGNVGLAEKWLETMTNASLKPNLVTYNAIVDACSKSGDRARAENWMFRMLEDGVKPDVVSFNSMIDACAKAGEPDRGLSWLRRMANAEVSPNNITFCTLINAFGMADKQDRAEEVLEMMSEFGVLPDASSYNALINAYSRANTVESNEAMWKAVESMKKKGKVEPNAVTFTTLARPYAQAGDWEKVEEIAEMFKAAPNLGEPLADPYFLNALLSAYSNAKPREQSKAERSFNEAVAAGCRLNQVVRFTLEKAIGPARARHLLRDKEIEHARPANPHSSRQSGGTSKPPNFTSNLNSNNQPPMPSRDKPPAGQAGRAQPPMPPKASELHLKANGRYKNPYLKEQGPYTVPKVSPNMQKLKELINKEDAPGARAPPPGLA